MATTGSSSGISFSGLFSGLDTDSIVKQLIALDSQPQTVLKTKMATLGYQKEALQSVNSSLLSLQETIKGFKSGIASNNKAVSSDEKVLTASANAGASQGVYSVNVIQMASKHRVGTDVQAVNYAGAGGTMNIAFGANSFNVNVANGETMETIASHINGSLDGATQFNEKAEALVIKDPVSGNKTIVIQTKTTGTANAITITDTVGVSALDLGFITGLGGIKNELQSAQDAVATINGVSVTNSTNSVTDSVYGVTFSITGFGAADVTVGPDDSESIASVKAFIDQFNKSTDMLDAFMKEEAVAGATTDTDARKGVLRNDSDLSETKSNIRVKTTGYLDSTLSTYKILQSIGIDSESSNGSIVSSNIELDEDKLKAALIDDPEEVSALLSGWADKLDAYLESQTKVSSADVLAGSYYRRILYIDRDVNTVEDDIASWDDRIAAIEERYRAQFSQMETLMQQMQSQGNTLSSQLSKLSTSAS